MFFATTNPSLVSRHAYRPGGRSLERFLDDAMQVNRCKTNGVVQDEKSYTLTFDVPGISREQLGIAIEGNVVRIQTKDDAPRQYKAAYELPTDIDVAISEAKLENGVLTLKLAKVVPVRKVTELAIN